MSVSSSSSLWATWVCRASAIGCLPLSSSSESTILDASYCGHWKRPYKSSAAMAPWEVYDNSSSRHCHHRQCTGKEKRKECSAIRRRARDADEILDSTITAAMSSVSACHRFHFSKSKREKKEIRSSVVGEKDDEPRFASERWKNKVSRLLGCTGGR